MENLKFMYVLISHNQLDYLYFATKHNLKGFKELTEGISKTFSIITVSFNIVINAQFDD